MRLFSVVCLLVIDLLMNFGSARIALAQHPETVKHWTFNTDGDNQGWTGTNGARVLMPSPAVNSDSACTKPFATTFAMNRNRAGR
ncbi:hypothetical protein Poly41_63510 [Novipirellula artificiosorum]|uniref:Uncharacterized protein n=1 Tax=Novipirellula artificiosorum TaxID=2528016 RepID=A0A5C6D2U8_9BACT|nr:hypothetical protein Poly41_63510 [Novipirellula artificiosorum]